MEKNNFWKFVFSFMPGAGYMYLGMMTKGFVVMLVFLGLMGLAGTMSMSFLLCVTPVIWFYAFFETYNLGKLDLETRLEKDKQFYEGILRLFDGRLTTLVGRKQKLIGGVFIFFAIYSFIYGVLMPLFKWDSRFWIISRIIHVLPTILVIVLLFKFGQMFMKEEETKEFKDYKEEVLEESTEEKDDIEE